MTPRMNLFACLLVLPLAAQEPDRKPSPFPEKEQKISRQEAAAAKAKARTAAPARSSLSKSRSDSSADAPSSSNSDPGNIGEACFFSKRASGGLTASGIRLNADELVAAHATYPLGSRVKVTNTANGKFVEVQIVDRFPLSKRIISVSEAAARQLGFIASGTAEVKLEPVSHGVASRERL